VGTHLYLSRRLSKTREKNGGSGSVQMNATTNEGVCSKTRRKTIRGETEGGKTPTVARKGQDGASKPIGISQWQFRKVGHRRSKERRDQKTRHQRKRNHAGGGEGRRAGTPGGGWCAGRGHEVYNSNAKKKRREITEVPIEGAVQRRKKGGRGGARSRRGKMTYFLQA